MFYINRDGQIIAKWYIAKDYQFESYKSFPIHNTFIAYHTGYNNKGGYDLFRNNRQFFIFPNPISHEIFFDLLPCHPVLF